jgi:hypothetical protein
LGHPRDQKDTKVKRGTLKLHFGRDRQLRSCALLRAMLSTDAQFQ